MRLLFLVLTVVLLCKCRVWQYAFAAATFQADAHDESRLGSEKYPVISLKKHPIYSEPHTELVRLADGWWLTLVCSAS